MALNSILTWPSNSSREQFSIANATIGLLVTKVDFLEKELGKQVSYDATEPLPVMAILHKENKDFNEKYGPWECQCPKYGVQWTLIRKKSMNGESKRSWNRELGLKPDFKRR